MGFRRNKAVVQARTTLGKQDWTRWLAVASFVLSIATFALTRYEAWDISRVKEEKAQYLSYRIGMDLGIHATASQFRDVPALKKVSSLTDEMLKNAASLTNELGLSIQISTSSLNSNEGEALRIRVLSRIRDMHGENAARAFALGSDLGQAIGALAPLKYIPEPTAATDLVPLHDKSALAALFANVNEQLKILQFSPSVSVGNTHTESLNRLIALDSALVNAWEPRNGRWKRKIEVYK